MSLEHFDKKNYTQHVNIKSKYLNSQEDRKIVISPQKSQISIQNSGQPNTYKDFHIDQLQTHNVQGNKITLHFDNGRNYQIQSRQPQRLNQALTHTRNVQMSNRFVEQPMKYIPMGPSYYQAMNPMMNLISGKQNPIGITGVVPPREQKIINDPRDGKDIYHSTNQMQSHPVTVISQQQRQQMMKEIQKTQSQNEKLSRKYTCVSYFKNPVDWRITQDEGKIVILNEEWRSNATKIVGFLVKKFLTTGSFMGLSFPVFAMKPQSILQTYAKSIASAPKIMTRTPDPIQRMKEFACFIWSMSLLQVTFLKPFNPVIGQTFQADINGGRYSAEQVCHHPPVSAFYYQKDNYKIYASLELSASIGFNSGEGRFLGDITIQYSDGHWIKGRLPNGQLTGILLGQTEFQTYGGAYLYDNRNLCLTYQLGDNNIFEGYLGTLNFRSAKNFQQQILKNEDRFTKFKAYPKEEYSKIFHYFTAKYGNWMAYDGKPFCNFNDQRLFPFQLQKPLQRECLLKSDSRFREDLELLKKGEVQKSQQQKERIQNQERANRKLRQKYNP